MNEVRGPLINSKAWSQSSNSLARWISYSNGRLMINGDGAIIADNGKLGMDVII